MSTPVRRFKLVLIGAAAVGKSSIFKRFTQGDDFRFNPDEQTTMVGAAASFRECYLPDGSKLILDLWDTAGQEIFRSLSKMYFQGAWSAVAVYDIHDKKSLIRAHEDIQKFKELAEPGAIVALAANKSDEEKGREVPKALVELEAAKAGYIFYETSAKTGQNLDNMFRDIVEQLAKIKPVAPPPPSSPRSKKSKSKKLDQTTGNGVIRLVPVSDKRRKRGCCD